LTSHRTTFLICGGAMLAVVVPYLSLTPRIEVAEPDRARLNRVRLNAESKRAVTKLAVLFGLDSIGGGFLNSALIAYWFFQRYGTSESQLAVLFFGGRALKVASDVMGGWMGRRVGVGRDSAGTQ